MNSQIKSEVNWNHQRNADNQSHVSAPDMYPILEEEQSISQNGALKHQQENIAKRLQHLNQQLLRKINQFIPPVHLGKSEEFRKSTIIISTFWINKVLNLIETLCYNREQGQQRLKQMDKHIRNLQIKRDESIFEAQSVKKQLAVQKNRMVDILKENQDKLKRESKEKIDQLKLQMQSQKEKHAEAIKNQSGKIIKRLEIQVQTFKRKLEAKENQGKKQKTGGFTVIANAAFFANQNFEKLMSKNQALQDLKKILQKRMAKLQETNQMFDNTVIQLSTRIPKLKKALGIPSCKSLGQSGRKQKNRDNNNIDLTHKKRMCEDLLFSMQQIIEAAQFPLEKVSYKASQPLAYEASNSSIAQNRILLQKLIEMKNRDYARNFNVSSELKKAKELLEFARKQMELRQGQTTIESLNRIQKSQRQLHQQSKRFIEEYGL